MHCTKNAIYKVCTIFRLHAVYQNYQLELPYKQSANLQIAHAFASPAGSATNSAERKTLIAHKFVPIRLANSFNALH